jgi:TonB family protein
MSIAIYVGIRITLLLVCAGLLSSAMVRASASCRHAVWAAALAGALLLPVISSVLPVTPLAILPEKPAPLVIRPLAVSFPAPAASSGPPLTERPATAKPTWNWTRWIALSWAAGAGVVLLQLFAAFRQLKALKAASKPADGVWTELVNEVCEKLSIPKPVDVRTGANPGPLTFGVFRKTILLPATAEEWSIDRRRLVLAHELAHVKRNDGLGQLLCQAACMVYWFDPLVWYAVHRLGVERERACDDYVLTGLGGSATDYAEHLVQIARTLNSGLGLIAASMAQRSQLKLRVLSILDSRMRRRQMTRFSMAVLLSLAAVTTLGLSSIQIARLSAMPLPAILTPLHPPGAVAPSSQTVASPAQAVGEEPGFTVNRLPISYPTEAMQKRVQGTVIVELDFNGKGEIVASRVLSGPEELRDAAIRTALQNNYPIRSARSLQVNVDFKLPPAETGEIAGITTDASRVPIPGVTVTATNSGTGTDLAAVTDEACSYRFPGMTAGTYRLTARLISFPEVSFNNVRLGESQQVRLNFALDPGSQSLSPIYAIPSIARISLPDHIRPGVIQTLVLTGLRQSAFAEVNEKLRNVKGQKLTTELLTQVRASIKETSWGDKPAGFVVSSRTDGTADLLIKFAERGASVNAEVIAGPGLDAYLQSSNAARSERDSGADSVKGVLPIYPQEAKDAKLQGVVVFEVDADANGTFSGLSTITGHPLLIPPALDAVRQWVFKPTLLDGQPVAAVHTVTLNFAFLP